jgi:hypothetical protein
MNLPLSPSTLRMIYGLSFHPSSMVSCNSLHLTVTFSSSFSVRRENVPVPAIWRSFTRTSPATFPPGPLVLVSRYLILAIGIASLVSFLKFLFPPITYGQSWSRPRKQAVTRSMSYPVILHASEPCRLRELPNFPTKCNGQFLSRFVSFSRPRRTENSDLLLPWPTQRAP